MTWKKWKGDVKFLHDSNQVVACRRVKNTLFFFLTLSHSSTTEPWFAWDIISSILIRNSGLFIEVVTFQKGYTDWKKKQQQKHEIERNNQFDNKSRISKLERKMPPPGGGVIPYNRLMGMCSQMGSHFHSLRSKRFQLNHCAKVRVGAFLFFFVLVPTFSTNSRGNACYAG